MCPTLPALDTATLRLEAACRLGPTLPALDTATLRLEAACQLAGIILLAGKTERKVN